VRFRVRNQAHPDERRLTRAFRQGSSESLHKHLIDDGRRDPDSEAQTGSADHEIEV
jgi:hypothetical protein